MLITLDPTGARPGDQASRRMAARRPLAGARVGLVSNGLGRTEDLLTLVHQDMLPGVRSMTRLARMPGYPYVVVDRSRTSLCDWDDPTIETVAKQAAAEAAALLSREAWHNV